MTRTTGRKETGRTAVCFEEPYCRPQFWLTEWPPGPRRARINASHHRRLVRRQTMALELKCASYARSKIAYSTLLLSINLTWIQLISFYEAKNHFDKQVNWFAYFEHLGEALLVGDKAPPVRRRRPHPCVKSFCPPSIVSEGGEYTPVPQRTRARSTRKASLSIRDALSITPSLRKSHPVNPCTWHCKRRAQSTLNTEVDSSSFEAQTAGRVEARRAQR